MSIQLEIFPQEHLGFSSDYTPPPLELLTNSQTFGDQLPVNDNPFGSLFTNWWVGLFSDTTPFLNSNSSINQANSALYCCNLGGTTSEEWIPGTWKRYRIDATTGGSGIGPSFDSQFTTTLEMGSATVQNFPSPMGVGFKFGFGLTPGKNYVARLKLFQVTSTTPPTGNITFTHIGYDNSTQTTNNISYPNGYPEYNPNQPSTTQTFNDPAYLAGTTLEFTFTAVGPNDVIWFLYSATLTQQILVESISCIEAGTDQEEIVGGNGVVIADLYEEENIPLTLSVDDFKNVAEKVQSYSKAFKLPSTKRNSKIFDNIFEITRTAQGTLAFNPYIKTKCRLREDGFVLFEGYLRLIDVVDKDGEISYNVNLYSEAVALADILAEKTFNDINFDELEHSYVWSQIKASWTAAGVTYAHALNFANGGFRNAQTVKYPFVDWNHQFLPYNDPSSVLNGFPQLDNLQTAFRPFINIKYLIDRIFNDSPFNYTSNFFNTQDFKKLYMDFNWGNDDAPTSGNESGLATYLTNHGSFLGPSGGNPTNYATTNWTNFKVYNDSFPVVAGWDDTNFKFVIPAGFDNLNADFEADIHYAVKRDTTIEFRWIKNEGVTATEEIFNYSGVFNVSGAAVANVRVRKQGVNNFSAISSTDIQAVKIWEPGFYTSPPTAVVTPDAIGTTSPTQATFNPTITGNDLTGCAIDDDGLGYTNFGVTYEMEFNGVNPNNYFNNIANNISLEAGDTLAFQWKAGHNNRVRQRDLGDMIQGLGTLGDANQKFLQTNNSQIQATFNYIATVADIKLKALRGDTEQWGFLKGIINMFNLITVPDKSNPNNITIEPYGEIFIENTDIVEHDWTDKVDVSEIKLTPLTELNQKTLFKFQEDEDDYPFMNYKKSTSGFLYGSRLFDASGFTILGGETEEISAEPFAATVCKPMMEQYSELIVPQVYALDDEGASEGFENLPRIMYDNGTKQILPLKYYVPPQNGEGFQWYDAFLQFSHVTDIQTIVSNPPSAGDTRDFNFGPCRLIGLGESPTNNLFSTYWQPYFGELYNADTRTMIIKVKLNSADINTFNMFDRVFIKNRVFRVNKIDYKPGDLSTVEFILIP